jgi:hypothetical protein
MLAGRQANHQQYKLGNIASNILPNQPNALPMLKKPAPPQPCPNPVHQHPAAPPKLPPVLIRPLRFPLMLLQRH